MQVTDFEWLDERYIRSRRPWKSLRTGNKINRVGFYMDENLATNMMGVPKYLRKAWDVVGIVSGHGRVRIGKTVSQNTKVRLINDKGITSISKELKEYNDGEILNTITINPETGEKILTKAEIIKEIEDKDFYILELEDGKKVSCTKEHKFYVKTKNKIKVLPLKEIKKGDEIICLKDNIQNY